MPYSLRKKTFIIIPVAQSGLCEERAIRALQIVCLFMPPASRRKLHFLLKLMNKMAANTRLTLDPNQSTRSLVSTLRCLLYQLVIIRGKLSTL